MPNLTVPFCPPPQNQDPWPYDRHRRHASNSRWVAVYQTTTYLLDWLTFSRRLLIHKLSSTESIKHFVELHGHRVQIGFLGNIININLELVRLLLCWAGIDARIDFFGFLFLLSTLFSQFFSLCFGELCTVIFGAGNWFWGFDGATIRGSVDAGIRICI